MLVTQQAPGAPKLRSDVAGVQEPSHIPFHLMTKLFSIAAIAALSVGFAPVAWAGSAMAQSIRNSSQAMRRARQRVPVGVEITDRQCTSIDTGRNTVWTCKVSWK